MSTVHDRWREGLEAEARLVEIDLPPDATDPAAVMRRGHRRRRRNQLVASVTCVGLVAGSAVVWSASRGDERRPTELRIADETTGTIEPDLLPAPSPTTVPGWGAQVDPAALPPVDLAPTAYRWEARDVPFGQGIGPSFFGSPSASPSGLVGVSTRPGVRSVSAGDGDEGRALYTSDDGVTWTGTAVDDSHWFGGITRSPRGLVAVGTAAATAPIVKTSEYGGLGDVVVSRSGDEGASWDDVVLPLDLRGAYERARQAGTPVQLGVSAAEVVERDGVTTVAVSVDGTPLVDLGSLVPGGVDPDYGYAPMPDGVLLLGGDGNGRTFTWAELGFGAEVAAWLGQRTLLFRSTDGTTFAPLGAPIDGYLNDLVAAGDTVTVIVSGLYEPSATGMAQVRAVEVGTGGDGRTLAPVPLDAGYLAAGELAGRPALAGNAGGWPALARWDGSAWRLSVLGAAVARPGANVGVSLAAVGAGGAAFAVDVVADPMYGVAVTDGGFTLRSDGAQRGFAVVEDATGAVLATLAALEPWAVPQGGRLRAVVGDAPATAVTTTMVGPIGAGESGPPTTNVVPTTLAPFEGTALAAVEVLDGSGAVVARLDVIALHAALEAAWASQTGGAAPRHEVVLLHSVDGSTWSSVDVGEAVGSGVAMVTGLVSTASGLAVTVSTTEPDANAPAVPGGPGPVGRQRALVGTSA